MEINSEDYKDYLREEYLSVHDAAELLEVGEGELRRLVQDHEIPTHTIAGVFLRLKKTEVEALKNKWRIDRELFPEPEVHFSHHNIVGKMTWADRLRDFWYFNDFYVICSVVIVILVCFIVSSQ